MILKTKVILTHRPVIDDWIGAPASASPSNVALGTGTAQRQRREGHAVGGNDKRGRYCNYCGSWRDRYYCCTPDPENDTCKRDRVEVCHEVAVVQLL